MNVSRRSLASVAALGGASALLAGCSGLAATITTDAGKISATIVTDVATLTNQYAIVKGIGQVAVAALSGTDPAAAKIITDGIKLIDGWITAGTSTVAANAATVVTTTQAILAAAAPAITAVKNATAG
jgi:hypothetical protein